MKDAIQKAIEGGWKYNYSKDIYCLWLDPLFWQALGKQQGWSEETDFSDIYDKEWTYNLHQFIDHTIEGGEIEDFFKELIK